MRAIARVDFFEVVPDEGRVGTAQNQCGKPAGQADHR
jgi:hypothetical protein